MLRWAELKYPHSILRCRKILSLSADTRRPWLLRIRENECLGGKHMKTIWNTIRRVFLFLNQVYYYLYHSSVQDGCLKSSCAGSDCTWELQNAASSPLIVHRVSWKWGQRSRNRNSILGVGGSLVTSFWQDRCCACLQVCILRHCVLVSDLQISLKFHVIANGKKYLCLLFLLKTCCLAQTRSLSFWTVASIYLDYC